MKFLRFVQGIQSAALIAIFVMVAIGVVLLVRWIRQREIEQAIVDAGVALKESTPLGAPARAIDSAISNATGREETLGGFLAEILDPTTRAANESLKRKPVGPAVTEDWSMEVSP